MAVSIEVEACMRRLKVKFYRTAALVHSLDEARKGGELSKFLKQLRQIDILICDE